MNEIQSKLDTLEHIFKKADAPIIQYFNLGLSKEEIIGFFLKHQIPLHPDLLSLYQWHNGMNSIYGLRSCLIDLMPGCSFPNLNEMLALRNDFLSYDYFEVHDRHEYVPFLSGGEDDMHLLKVSTGQIYHSSPSIQIYCERSFVSIPSMLDFIIKCYATKVLKIDLKEGLQVDDKYWKIEEDVIKLEI